MDCIASRTTDAWAIEGISTTNATRESTPLAILNFLFIEKLVHSMCAHVGMIIV